MKNKDYYDVLNIIGNIESVDIIQALAKNKCLGTFFQNGTAKLYFNKGYQVDMNIMLKELLKDRTVQWNWETQAPKDWHLSWQDHFKPLLIDNKLAVIPPWKNDY